MILLHPGKKRLPHKSKPKNRDTKKNPGREMPPEMMETSPFPGIPFAVLTAPNAPTAVPSAVRTYLLLLYQVPTTAEVLCVLLYVLEKIPVDMKKYPG